jgi:hypothetical protein
VVQESRRTERGSLACLGDTRRCATGRSTHTPHLHTRVWGRLTAGRRSAISDQRSAISGPLSLLCERRQALQVRGAGRTQFPPVPLATAKLLATGGQRINVARRFERARVAFDARAPTSAAGCTCADTDTCAAGAGYSASVGAGRRRRRFVLAEIQRRVLRCRDDAGDTDPALGLVVILRPSDRVMDGAESRRIDSAADGASRPAAVPRPPRFPPRVPVCWTALALSFCQRTKSVGLCRRRAILQIVSLTFRLQCSAVFVDVDASAPSRSHRAPPALPAEPNIRMPAGQPPSSRSSPIVRRHL